MLINVVPASGTLSASSPSATKMVMSCPDADESREDFSSIVSSSSSEDDDPTDSGAVFCLIPASWMPEQRKVLMLRVEDWKASKNSKSQQLVLQGAMTDLQCLSVAPPMDELKLVRRNALSTVGVINVCPSGSRPGIDKMLGNRPRLPSVRCRPVAKSLPTSTAPK